MPLTVFGLRHGDVQNPDGVIYAGLPGYGLSDHGRAQAARVADDLRSLEVVAIYSSPLERAMETAALLSDATGTDVRADDRLHEWRHWQRWAGMTWMQMQEEAAEAWIAYRDDPGAVTSGESLAELGERMAAWLGDVQAGHPDGVVVGVSHLEPLRMLLLRLLDRPASHLFDVAIGLCEVVRLSPEPSTQPGLPSRLLAMD